jgi:DNA repair exonuclease SbcCD ATPase subunit
MDDVIKVPKVKIPVNAKIKVYWDDKPENYSKENKITVRNHFAKKYGVSKSNINVVYRPVKINKKGETVEISGAGIENIMDVGYQRELFKEWLTREDKDIDFNRLCKLDDKINAELNIDATDTVHKSWSLKWMMLNGFLCFGEKNFVSFANLDGLTIVNSYPENQGGKTTFSVDAFKFLLYGKTSKTDKNEQVFNQYWGNDELIVRGMITLEGRDIIIERLLSRKKKRNGGWNVTNKLNFYEILPDGEEVEMNDEDAKATTEEIKATIGDEKDFELVTLATARNLDDLIGLTTTESGKLLTRFIGLEVIELKSEVARKLYNTFAKTKKSNTYDIITLRGEIDGYEDTKEDGTTVKVAGHSELIIQYNEGLLSLGEQLKTNDELISKYNNDKDALLVSKKQIDAEILSLDPSTLNEQIDKITATGVTKKARIDELVKTIEPLKLIKFDEDRHHVLTNRQTEATSEKAVKAAEKQRLEKVVSDLVAGGICQTCNRALDNVDNSAHIAEHKKGISTILGEWKLLDIELTKIKSELGGMTETKSKVDSKDKLEVEKDRTELELEGLRTKIKSKKEDLKKYNANLEGIQFNANVDSKIELVKTKLNVCDHTKTELTQKIERTKMEITKNEQAIVTKETLIGQIKKEEEVDKLFKVYIDMVGKKGISKLVLRSVLPIINSEVQRLLDGVVDFDVEIFINDKNDVQFMIIKDEVEKHLKSGSGLETTAASIALRCVLGKMSCLPMPNFITFDEVLGKVASINIPLMKPLFDKITDMYDTVFFITHNEEVKDWSTNTITIIKENNISRISVM